MDLQCPIKAVTINQSIKKEDPPVGMTKEDPPVGMTKKDPPVDESVMNGFR